MKRVFADSTLTVSQVFSARCAWTVLDVDPEAFAIAQRYVDGKISLAKMRGRYICARSGRAHIIDREVSPLRRNAGTHVFWESLQLGRQPSRAPSAQDAARVQLLPMSAPDSVARALRAH
jgi:hypothetical protein